MTNQDCFAWLSGHKCCKALTKTLCRKGECSFYKTKEQYERDFPDTVPQAQRPVIREDGICYPTATAAAAAVGVTLGTLLSHLNGYSRKSGGYKWHWAK